MPRLWRLRPEYDCERCDQLAHFTCDNCARVLCEGCAEAQGCPDECPPEREQPRIGVFVL